MAEFFQLLREARLLTAFIIGTSAVVLAIAGGSGTTISISSKMKQACGGLGLAFMSPGLGGHPVSFQTGNEMPVPTPTIAAPTVTNPLAPTSALAMVAIYTRVVSLTSATVPSTLQCDPQVYYGIQHCTQGAVQILRIDPKAPHVRFETVLSQGYDRDGDFGECRDVNMLENSTGPGCQVDGKYPVELVGDMAGRYPGAVAAFNADFFGRTRGPGGLTLKNGMRLDGIYGDHDENEVTRCSLSISSAGDVRIGIVDRSSLPNPSEPWTWIPDPLAYHNSVGGIPLLVHDGAPTNIKKQCMVETPRRGSNTGCSIRHHVFRRLHRRFMKHDASSSKEYECSSRRINWYNCPSPSTRRARTAVGKTEDGQLIVTVVPESAGLTLYQLADTLIELGAVEAINLDGGRSSQLWYDGDHLVSPGRPVANGMLIFSQVRQPPTGSW